MRPNNLPIINHSPHYFAPLFGSLYNQPGSGEQFEKVAILIGLRLIITTTKAPS
jgi:hypothetical protein